MDTVVSRYLDTWNATDAAARDELLAAHWAESCRYVDPLAEVEGRAAVAATVAAVQQQFPGFVFTPVGDVDAHHRQCRFQWGLGPAGEPPVVVGFDVLEVDEDGRIQDVRGFLDQVPA